MRYLLVALILIHGLIHLMGFSKAFGLADMKQLSIPISKTAGFFWLLATLLFSLTVILFLVKSPLWIYPCLTGCVVSQAVIMLSWKDARYGTVVNIILIIIAVLSLTTQLFERSYKKDVAELMKKSTQKQVQLLTDDDIRHLPVPVQRYLHYTGVMNKPKVRDFSVVFEGEMREKGKGFFSFRAEQYNFMEDPARLFFMKGQMYGVTVPGYHRYVQATATMDIRLFGMIPVIQASGPEMDTTETVTLFNDMCLLAPATLIDQRISWEPVDSLTVKAVFSNRGIRISAWLYFNEQGQLVNFISQDRTAIAVGRKLPFSTPVTRYAPVNGLQLMAEGSAVWEYPDGKFEFGKFRLKSVSYNAAAPDM